MLIVSLALAAGWAASVAALLRHLAGQARTHSRREDLLLNQLLHAVGKPWTAAPAEEQKQTPELPGPRRWTATPEQQPVE